MRLRMFDALLPYFGGKRKLCPAVFARIAKYIPRDQWREKVFVDPFMGGCAVSLYAKALGFGVIATDIADRSVIAGEALISNSHNYLTSYDLYKLLEPNPENNKKYIQTNLVPHVFSERHAAFLDNAFANATTSLQKYLLIKYVFHLRPFSKFSSPNAFNRPFAEGRFDQIKPTYTKHIKDNLKTPLEIMRIEKERINAGIFFTGFYSEVYKADVFELLMHIKMEMLGEVLAEAEKFPLWVISFGNAGGKNDLAKLVEMVSKFRKCEAHEFAYRHCEAMAVAEMLARAYNGKAYNIYKSGKKLKEGLKTIDKALNIMPNDAMLLSTKAELLYKLGRLNEAYDYIKRAIVLNPDEPEIKQYLENSEKAIKNLTKKE